MKRTGPTNERAKMLIALLQKAGRKGKSSVWLDLAERLGMPTRQRAAVNLWKLDKLAGIFPGKNLVVPGKVLGFGEIYGKASVISFEFSSAAENKIRKAGGKAILMEDAVKQDVKPASMIIVK